MLYIEHDKQNIYLYYQQQQHDPLLWQSSSLISSCMTTTESDGNLGTKQWININTLSEEQLYTGGQMDNGCLLLDTSILLNRHTNNSVQLYHVLNRKYIAMSSAIFIDYVNSQTVESSSYCLKTSYSRQSQRLSDAKMSHTVIASLMFIIAVELFSIFILSQFSFSYFCTLTGMEVEQ